jgi:hypothetical protein
MQATQSRALLFLAKLVEKPGQGRAVVGARVASMSWTVVASIAVSRLSWFWEVAPPHRALEIEHGCRRECVVKMR